MNPISIWFFLSLSVPFVILLCIFKFWTVWAYKSSSYMYKQILICHLVSCPSDERCLLWPHIPKFADLPFQLARVTELSLLRYVWCIWQLSAWFWNWVLMMHTKLLVSQRSKRRAPKYLQGWIHSQKCQCRVGLLTDDPSMI